MKVSVVVPAYNEEKYIAKCLQSLLEQNEKADEIIVVDNNSKDKTGEIAKSYGVRVIEEKTQGITYARTLGFNSAKFEIIARVDADTTVPKDWISRIKNNFEDKNTDVAFGPFYYLHLPKIIQISHFPSIAYAKFLKLFLKNNIIYGANMAIRASVWNKVKADLCVDDKDVHDDFDLAIHLWKYTEIKFDEKLVVSTSPRRWSNFISYIEYINRLRKMLKSHQKTTH
jgi:glycosyltransferase involved in cell wall biosynthesis